MGEGNGGGGGGGGESHYKAVSTNHSFWRERRAEAEWNQGPSAYHCSPTPYGYAKPAYATAGPILTCYFPAQRRVGG